jgi:diaminopimelate decarboxylase
MTPATEADVTTIDPSAAADPLAGAVGEALARFGTPLYLYDERRLVDALERIESAVVYPGAHFHYAMVANRAWRVLSTVARTGWRFHFNAPMELEVARRALHRDGGFTAEEIDRVIAGSVFSGGSISAEQMRDVIARGVFVHVTACDQLALFGALAGGRSDRSVGLRVQFDANMRRGRQGIPPAEIPRAMEVAREHGLSITSVHMYRGTGMREADTFAKPFGDFVAIAKRFPELRSLDIGGGFGYDYRTRGESFDWTVLAGFVDGMMREVNEAFGRRIELRLEIGRAAVAGAGLFATRVLSRKPGFAEGEVILGVDASSMSVKASAPAVVGKRHHYSIETPRPGADREETYTLVGPTTYTSDYLAKRVRVTGGGADGVQPGDVILVLDCGAYGAVIHSEFLTTPRPAEAMLTADGELVALAHRTGVDEVTGNWA